MSDFTFHTLETAPKSALPLLQQAQDSLGFIPNLYAGLATAPAVLEAYYSLSALLDKTSFTPTERQVMALVVSVENRCYFCVAAHSMIARQMLGVSEEIVTALRESKKLPDARLQALVEFTEVMRNSRGNASKADVSDFLAAGFTRQHVLEVILAIAMKTVSNYANHVMQTPLNSQFADFKWP